MTSFIFLLSCRLDVDWVYSICICTLRICILQSYSIHILHIWYMSIASLYWGVCFHLFLSLYAITHAWSNTTLCSSCRSILKTSYMYLHPIFFHHHLLLEIPCYIQITKDVGFRTCPRFSCHSERIQTERNKFRHFRLRLGNTARETRLGFQFCHFWREKNAWAVCRSPSVCFNVKPPKNGLRNSCGLKW